MNRLASTAPSTGFRLLTTTAFSLGAFVATLAGPTLVAQTTQHYKLTPLTSNLASLAPIRDPNLVNPWGLSRSSGGPWWISDNGTGVSTLYDGAGKVIPLVVSIPASGAKESAGKLGTPTGTIFNGDPNAFPIAPGKPAIVLFATEDGAISGWNPGVSPSAVIVVNHKDQSVYKGLTSATAEIDGVTRTLLYAADFRQGRVAVFDSAFKPVHLGEEASEEERYPEGRHHRPFEDERIPEGYAPFNVQNIGGNIYVAFAKQDSARHDEVEGAGNGYVAVFSPTGRFLLQLEHGAWFNAPWGIALGASDFGSYSHDVLIGQFGTGQILAFDPLTGKFKGRLDGANNQPLVIDGLWAIAFGNDAGAGPATTLYFAAGTNHEVNGLFGSITAIENPEGNDN